MDKKIRLRLIGVGTMGSVYVQYLLQGDCPDFILAAVSDINIARKDWVDAQTDAHSHPPVAFFTDAKQIKILRRRTSVLYVFPYRGIQRSVSLCK